MSDRDSCRHHFDHVKQTRPFTEREYMECTKCGLRNPLGLFQTVDFRQPGTPVYAAKPGETYTPRNQPEYFYRGHIRDDGTHDVYRIPMNHISKDNPPSEYIGNFTKEQIQNGDHRK